MAEIKPFNEDDLAKLISGGLTPGGAAPDTAERVLRATKAISKAVRNDDGEAIRSHCEVLSGLLASQNMGISLTDMLNRGDGTGDGFLLEAVYAKSPNAFAALFDQGCSQDITTSGKHDRVPGLSVAEAIAMKSISDQQHVDVSRPLQQGADAMKQMMATLDPLTELPKMREAIAAKDWDTMDEIGAAIEKRDYKPAAERKTIPELLGDVYGGGLVAGGGQSGIIMPNTGHTGGLFIPGEAVDKKLEKTPRIYGGSEKTVLQEVLDHGDKRQNPMLVEAVLADPFDKETVEQLVKRGADPKVLATDERDFMYTGKTAGDVLQARAMQLAMSTDPEHAPQLRALLEAGGLFGMELPGVITPPSEEESPRRFATDEKKNDGRVNRRSERDGNERG